VTGLALSSLPPTAPFLDTVAADWLAAFPDDPGRGLILLPTRRAARALVEAFLHVSGGRPMLLPRVTAIGALDEAPLALSGALDLPPAVGEAERLALLTRMILAMPDHARIPLDRAWMLAAELASLMDEAERTEIDLAAALPGAADAAHAEHWARTLDFLALVTKHWPAVLAERGQMNPAARHAALLDAQARAWAEAPPDMPVWAAGMTSAVPSVGRLLRTVARLPSGRVIFPGLDFGLPDAAFEGLAAGHWQAGLAAMLSRLDATRGDVTPRVGLSSDVPTGRAALLGRALLPADLLGQWTAGGALEAGEPEAGEPGAGEREAGGLFRLEAADAQQEAVAIALILRDALERPGQRAALVTPDRVLAGRVAAELGRFGIVADDSAGEKLTQTPPGAFLRLLARALADRLAPVALLSVLKHPLAACGMAPAAFRASARELELAALRGPMPVPDIAGLRRKVTGKAGARATLARIERALEPALRMDHAAGASPGARLAALVAAAEGLAATDEASGAARLWGGEEGEKLAGQLAEAMAALEVLAGQDMRAADLPGLLDAVLEGAVVRSRRALRGRDAAAEHPRVFIWGLLEARLQSADVVVLGGLAEGTWPPAAEPGPWLSRPMRTAIGLPAPEERVGLSAHDFVMAACCAPVAVLSCPVRRDGAPAVPARFLARLETMLEGRGAKLPRHPAAGWAAALDQPFRVEPEKPPQPCPPVSARPRRLSVTEIETWRRDPYAIYAKHVLKLRALDDLEAQSEAADFGNIVHAGLEAFLKAHGAAWPANADALLRDCFDRELVGNDPNRALATWWRPRLMRIADWITEMETQRRADGGPRAIVAEVSGAWTLEGPAGPFVLRGKADRIEVWPDEGLVLVDYKTGGVPTQDQIKADFAPQLPLLGAMAECGAFGDVAGKVAELAYWKVSGAGTPGQELRLFKGDLDATQSSIANAIAALRKQIELYDDPAMPYRSRPFPGEAPRFSDYVLLARVAEWATAEDGSKHVTPGGDGA
jgi:ATP-dependent helicase/nuclease subunit B